MGVVQKVVLAVGEQPGQQLRFREGGGPRVVANTWILGVADGAAGGSQCCNCPTRTRDRDNGVACAVERPDWYGLRSDYGVLVSVAADRYRCGKTFGVAT